MHAKGRASAALQQAQQQLDQSSEHLTLLKKQLAEERQSDAALSANLDSVQAELAQCKTQVDPCTTASVELPSKVVLASLLLLRPPARHLHHSPIKPSAYHVLANSYAVVADTFVYAGKCA